MMRFKTWLTHLNLKTLVILTTVTSVLLGTGISYQGIAGQNTSSTSMNQSPYQLFPLPEVIVTSPAPQTSNASNGNTNDSFVYPSPNIQLVNVPEGIDSSCYNLTLYELVNKSTDLCYALQINELLKHPVNQSQREALLKQPLPNEFFDDNMTDHFDQKYTLKFLKKSHTQQLQELFEKLPLTVDDQTDSQCDTSIYDDMVNPGIPRFFMLHPCVTVTGNITLVHNPSGRFDGDVVFASLDQHMKILLRQQISIPK